MKIIKRYILSEYLSSFFFGIAVFTFVLLLDQIFQVINMIISKGVKAGDAFKLFALMLPNILSLSIPISSLYGAILSFGRLSADNEIVAIKIAGISYLHFVSPPVILNILLAIVLVFYNFYISPQTYKEFNQTYFELLQTAPTLKLEEKSIIEIANNRVYFERKDKKGQLHNVSIYRYDDEGLTLPTMFINAKYATVSVENRSISFSLYDGITQKIDMTSPAALTSLRFSKYNITIPFEDKPSYTKSLREYSASEIVSEIKSYRHKGLSPSIFETEYNLRLAVGIAPFFFVVVGIPLGLVAQRGTRSAGFGLSIVVVFVYYVFLALGINFSDKNFIPSLVALQIPNMVAVLFSIFLWKKVVKS